MMNKTGEGHSLTGWRALVCGSTQGIGRACAMEFALQGAQVTLFARNESSLRQVLGELPPPLGAGSGEETHGYLVADFDHPSAVRDVVREFLERGNVFHILLNNSGGPAPGAILEAEPAAFERAFSRHLLCNQILAQALVPGMKEAGYGRVINIVSTSVRQPIKRLGVSNTVRGAVASWAKTLAGELAPFGITVNNILPGATRTGRLVEFVRARARAAGVAEEEMEKTMQAEIPAGRFGRPEELAWAAAFLASPAAAYITGVSLPVDGGRTMAL